MVTGGGGAGRSRSRVLLLSRLRREDGTFASSVRPDGTLVDGRFDLYEQAFVLFALAVAYRVRPAMRARLRDEASTLRATLKRGWSHPSLGFEEGNPRTLPASFESAHASAGSRSGMERNRR